MPPIRVLMGAFVGWKPKPEAADAEDVFGPEDLANFLSQFPGGEMVAPPPE